VRDLAVLIAGLTGIAVAAALLRTSGHQSNDGRCLPAGGTGDRDHDASRSCHCRVDRRSVTICEPRSRRSESRSRTCAAIYRPRNVASRPGRAAELSRLTRLLQGTLDMARIDAAAIRVDRDWVAADDVGYTLSIALSGDEHRGRIGYQFHACLFEEM
jgi:hypothetical protein